MSYLHIIGRALFSILGGLFIAVSTAIASSLLGFGFGVILSQNFYMGVAVGIGLGCIGFFYGFYKGCQLSFDFYKSHIEQPMALWQLKRDAMRPCHSEEALKENEISAFQKLMEQPGHKAAKYKKQWEKYENYVSNNCGISMEPIGELKDPLTIEGVTDNKPWIHTFDAKSFIQWMDNKGTKTTDPLNNLLLLDKKNNVTVYRSYPHWVSVFIISARKMIFSSSQTKMMNELELKEQKAPVVFPTLQFSYNQLFEKSSEPSSEPLLLPSCREEESMDHESGILSAPSSRG